MTDKECIIVEVKEEKYVMNYEERDEYVQQKANEYCKKEKERGTLMKIKGVEPLVYKAYKNGYYESEKENKQLTQENKRAKVLLKATLDLLRKQKDSYYVLNLLENTAFYDNAECDGYCLFDDIENFLYFGS